MPCDLGAHWLDQHKDLSLVVGMEPYAWPSAQEAYAAVERYELQLKLERTTCAHEWLACMRDRRIGAP